MNASDEQITNHLKQTDPDRYFSTLVLPKSSGPDVCVLYSFAAEIAQTRERITEPATGEIRLQYWVDLLSGTQHGATQQNPIAQGLLEIIDRYDLPTGPLRRLLAARRFDLFDDPMVDIAAFEGYAGETNSILYQLATLIVNGGNDALGANAAGHLGVAHAIIGHLRSLPITASRGQIYLPWSVFVANGVTQRDFFAGKATPQIIAACTTLQEIAAEHLRQAKFEILKLDANIRPVFSQISILEGQLNRLSDFSNIPFAPPPDFSNWQKIAKIVWWSIKH